MAKEFYEIVVEGNYHTIFGFLEGFMLGAGKRWNYYFSRNAHIKRDTLSEILKQWLSMASKIHHIIIEAEFLNQIKAALDKHGDQKNIGKAYLKSERKIKSAAFDFEFKTYSKKHANEIKTLLESLPAGINLTDYVPTEIVDKDAKGVELYSPQHEYEFSGKGKIKGGFPEIIEVWQKFDDNPLMTPQQIEIEFE